MIIFKKHKIPIDKKAIQAFHTDRLLPYERKVLAFVKEWYSESPTIVVKTSGTTGKPKEMSFTKGQLVESARRTISFLGLQKGEKALLSLSTDYIAGKLMLVRAIVGDLDLYVREPESNPLLSLEEDIDFAAFVPMQVREMLREKVSFERFRKIRNLIIGGGVLNIQTEKQLSSLSQNIYHTYGMTETLTHIAMRRIAPKNQNFYSALPGVSFRQDERACLVIDVPYLYNEAIVSNDIVELLDEYSFQYIGRYDNVINSGGVKLFPEEIEKRLADFIAVPYYISSESDERLGQRVVLKIESNRPVEGLEKLLTERLERYERPKKIYYLSEFERTKTGKVIRD